MRSTRSQCPHPCRPIDTKGRSNQIGYPEVSSRVSGKEVALNFFNSGSVDTELHRYENRFIQTLDRVVGGTPEEGERLLICAAVVKLEKLMANI